MGDVQPAVDIADFQHFVLADDLSVFPKQSLDSDFSPGLARERQSGAFGGPQALQYRFGHVDSGN